MLSRDRAGVECLVPRKKGSMSRAPITTSGVNQRTKDQLKPPELVYDKKEKREEDKP